MGEAKPVNGQINLAKWIPEFVGKVLGPWLRRAPEDGPGMYRYGETPGVTAEERAAMEPPHQPREREYDGRCLAAAHP